MSFTFIEAEKASFRGTIEKDLLFRMRMQCLKMMKTNMTEMIMIEFEGLLSQSEIHILRITKIANGNVTRTWLGCILELVPWNGESSP